MNRKYNSLRERITGNVIITPSGCWEWSLYRDRYGIIGMGGVGTKKAHRVSWEAFNGPIPNGAQVLHRCDNPPCCNPDHLFLGTQKDNMEDANSKGRLLYPHCPISKKARGDRNGMRTHPGMVAREKNPNSKISNLQRREIFLRRNSGEKRISLAKEFHLDEGQIYRICKSEEKKDAIADALLIAEYGRRTHT